MGGPGPTSVKRLYPPVTSFGNNVRMPEELEGCQLRADIHALEGRIITLEVKIASLPTTRDITRVAFWAVLAGAVMVVFALFGVGAFFR